MENSLNLFNRIENEKFISDELIYNLVTKPKMTSELFVTGGFRKPSSEKNCLKIIMTEKKILTCSSTNFMTAHG